MEEKETNVDIQARLKQICNDHNITYYKLERELGFSNGSLAKLKSLTYSRAVKIAGYLGVTPAYLLGVVENEQEVDSRENILQQAFDANPEMRTLFSLAKDAPKEDIEYVIKKLQALKDEK